MNLKKSLINIITAGFLAGASLTGMASAQETTKTHEGSFYDSKPRGLSTMTLPAKNFPEPRKTLSYEKDILYDSNLVDSNYWDNPSTINAVSDTNRMNLEELMNKHTAKLKFSTGDENLYIELKREDDNKVFGRKQLTIEDYSATFRYLPRRFCVELREDEQLVESTPPIDNQIMKTIIVDREVRPQKMYLIEGDEFNPFAEIVAESLISTGLPHMDKHPGSSTALGYFYVHRKKELSTNARNNWIMPWALWYLKDSGMQEGQNGIHSYEHTHFGRPASHGCVREPEEFSKKSYKWTPVGTPVIIIGKDKRTDQDYDRFNPRDYSGFTKLIDYLLTLPRGYTSETMKENEINALEKLRPILLEMRQQGKTSVEKPNTEGFNSAVDELVGQK